MKTLGMAASFEGYLGPAWAGQTGLATKVKRYVGRGPEQNRGR